MEPQIDILVELSINGASIFNPSMFYHQCNMSRRGEKVLVTNLTIARKRHDIKAKKAVPINDESRI